MPGILTAVAAFLAAPSILQSMMAMYPPFQALMARTGYRDRPDLIPTVEQQLTLRLRGEIDNDQYIATMRQAGLNEEHATRLYNSSQSYLTAADYITLWRREEMTEEELSAQLSKLGFRADQQEMAKRATLYYPNPEDIVRFAVREVYNPDAVRAFGLDQDLPPEYLETSKRAGLSDEFATQFWRAHWQLPSPIQVYEMLHRRVINEEQVEQYMKAADFMPSWRQPLIDISYRPLTRVDVRRMHAMQVLTREQVKSAYRDLGYDERNAELMTEFTVRYNQGQEGEAPSSIIMRRYERGSIDKLTAEQQLRERGFSEDAITQLLQEADEELQFQLIDLRADALVDQYNRGELTMDQLRVELTQIGVPNDMLNRVIMREQIQAIKRTKLPTKATLDRWILSGIITEEDYVSRMERLGYRPGDIELYLRELAIKALTQDTRQLSLTQYIRFYLEGRMSEEELREQLARKRYSQDDIDDLVAQANDKLEASRSAIDQTNTTDIEREYRTLTLAQFTRLYIEGRKSIGEFREYLSRRNYAPGDIDDLVAQADAKIMERNQ